MYTVSARVSALSVYTLSELTPVLHLYSGYTVSAHTGACRTGVRYIERAVRAPVVQFKLTAVHCASACILSRKSGAQCTDHFIALCRRTAYYDYNALNK